MTGGLRKKRLAAAPEPARSTRSDSSTRPTIELTIARKSTDTTACLSSVTGQRPSVSQPSTNRGGADTANWSAADHSRSGVAPIHRWPSVPRLRVSMLSIPMTTATGPPAWPRSAPSTMSTPTTPTTKPPTCTGVTRSPRSAAASSTVSTGLSAWKSEARVAPRPRSKATYIRPNWTAFITKPTAATRPTVPRSMRVGRCRTRARPAARTAAITKRQPSTENGAAAWTAAGPEM